MADGKTDAAVARRPGQVLFMALVCGTAIVLDLFFGARAYPAAPGLGEVYDLPPALAVARDGTGGEAALNQGIKALAADLFASLADPDPEMGDLADGVAMGVFVDLARLTRTSSLGRYLSEQLMTEFQQHGYRVVELRKSRAVLVRAARGDYGLSRDPDNIASAAAARALVTGTYTVTGGKVLINARVLDNKDATVLASATTTLPLAPAVRVLLADSAVARPRQPGTATEMTYMKRLE